jgi:hypothetical protein
VIGEPQEKNSSTVMQALKLGFARRVLAEAKRKRNPAQSTLFEHTPQHIWQKRFYDFNVWTERKRIEKLRYMHRNPVKRGLVASPELWHWSSFRSRAYWRSLDLVSDCWSVDRSLAGLHRRSATLPPMARNLVHARRDSRGRIVRGDFVPYCLAAANTNSGNQRQARHLLTKCPVLVRVHRIGETCSDEQVTPVSLGKLYRSTEFSQASLAQLERSKTNAL